MEIVEAGKVLLKCKKNQFEVKAIVKRFEEADVLIVQTKVSPNAWFS